MNRENLEKLARFLWNLPEEDATKRFDMKDFNTRHGSPLSLVGDKEICETASCAVGWGPTAGILPTKEDSTWVDYCDNHICEGNTPEWYWMFSSAWREIDNTPKGAAKRIFWLLENGVPTRYMLSSIMRSNGFVLDRHGEDSIQVRRELVEIHKDWTPSCLKGNGNDSSQINVPQ